MVYLVNFQIIFLFRKFLFKPFRSLFQKKQDTFEQRSIGKLDLRYCNFTPEEAEILKNKLENCGCRNLLI